MIFLVHIVQLVCHEGQGCAAFQNVGPVGGHEASSEADAFQGAGDGGGGVALAGVVGRDNETAGRYPLTTYRMGLPVGRLF